VLSSVADLKSQAATGVKMFGKPLYWESAGLTVTRPYVCAVTDLDQGLCSEMGLKPPLTGK
jgi:hypothetical protein